METDELVGGPIDEEIRVPFAYRCYSGFWRAYNRTYNNVLPYSKKVVASSFFTSDKHTNAEIRAWGLSSKFDFFRRFLIGGSKISGVVSIILFICSTMGVLRVTALEKNHAWIVAPTFLLGALFELCLSMFPKVNRAISPVYNAALLLIERFFLEVASLMILLCGLEQVPNIPSRFLPDRECIYNVKYFIFAPLLIFSIPHLISSIVEYKKYRHIAEGGTTIHNHCCSANKHLVEAFHICWHSLSMMVETGLSMLSLMATISIILDIRNPSQSVPKIATIVYEFSPAILMAGFFGLLECRKQTTRGTKRLMHALVHYLEPTLANYYVAAYIVFGVLMAPVYLITETPALVVNFFFIAITYALVPVLNFLRAHESYRFQYTLLDKLNAERDEARINKQADGEEIDEQPDEEECVYEEILSL